MKKVLCFVALVAMITALSGCDMFVKNSRQTAKNVKAVALDGHPQDLYADK